MAVTNAGGVTRSTEGLTRTRRQRKGEFTLCWSQEVPLLPLGINAFGSQAFRLRLGPTPLAPLHLAFGFEEELRHQCSGPSASQLQIAELLSLHNHMSPS